MVKRVKVALWGKQNRGVLVDLDATQGAVVGNNLRLPDGSLVTLGQILNPKTVTVGPVSGVSTQPTVWDLILNIPNFIKSLAALAGTGLVVRSVADGTGAEVRTLQGEVGRIEITDGDGVAGDPTIALGPFPTVKPSVETGEVATVPAGHQFLVADEMVLDGGEVVVEDDGELIVMGLGDPQYPMVKDNLPSSVNLNIVDGEQLLVYNSFDIGGILNCEGILAVL